MSDSEIEDLITAFKLEFAGNLPQKDSSIFAEIRAYFEDPVEIEIEEDRYVYVHALGWREGEDDLCDSLMLEYYISETPENCENDPDSNEHSFTRIGYTFNNIISLDEQLDEFHKRTQTTQSAIRKVKAPDQEP